MAVPNYQRNVPEIITDLFTQLATLFHKETQLARAELSENIAGVGRSLRLIVGGAVLLIPALVILLQAAVAGLADSYGLASYWSALIVGATVLVIGLILLLIGTNSLKIENLMPHRTVHQLRRDASVAKEQVSRDHDLHRAA
jgi:Putative Actinobacterial Holin-X, holin superfamily III